MDLTEKHIELLKRILSETCTDDKCVSRSKIFTLFEREAKSGMEQYRFERSISNLVKTGKITGFTVKTGRTGGISRNEPQERIEILCSSGKYMGTVSSIKLHEILSLLR